MDAAVYFYTLPAECVFLLLRDWQVVFSGFNGFGLKNTCQTLLMLLLLLLMMMMMMMLLEAGLIRIKQFIDVIIIIITVILRLIVASHALPIMTPGFLRIPQKVEIYKL